MKMFKPIFGIALGGSGIGLGILGLLFLCQKSTSTAIHVLVGAESLYLAIAVLAFSAALCLTRG